MLQLQEEWCYLKRCEEHPDLAAEDLAIQEVLSHHDELDYRGLVVLIDGKVQAFSLGEPLNPTCAVIHIEKANPDIRGLYVAINQAACRDLWSGHPYVNREQDLGAAGLAQSQGILASGPYGRKIQYPAFGIIHGRELEVADMNRESSGFQLIFGLDDASRPLAHRALRLAVDDLFLPTLTVVSGLTTDILAFRLGKRPLFSKKCCSWSGRP